MMKEILNRKAGSRTRMLATALLASTLLAGGGFAWSEAGAATEAAPPLGLAPVVNQAGFADLVAKVRPAVVNIATTEAAQQATEQEAPDPQQQPSFPPNSPFGQMFRHFFDQQGSQSAGPHARPGLGLHRRSGRLHRDQQPRRRRRAQDQRDAG